MGSRKQSERLEKLEAEEAALDQRISKLEALIHQHQEEGRVAYRQKNVRKAKEKARCLSVLNKQLDQLSAMKINIFECLQSEAMRGFVTNYAEAIKPVNDAGSLSVERAQANIDGTVDFMDRIGELTDVVTDELSGGTFSVQSELEELFGGDEGEDGGSQLSASAESGQASPIAPLPNVPTDAVSSTNRKPPSEPDSVAELESTLRLINL